jgi:hypothetical protein
MGQCRLPGTGLALHQDQRAAALAGRGHAPFQIRQLPGPADEDTVLHCVIVNCDPWTRWV